MPCRDVRFFHIRGMGVEVLLGCVEMLASEEPTRALVQGNAGGIGRRRAMLGLASDIQHNLGPMQAESAPGSAFL